MLREKELNETNSKKICFLTACPTFNPREANHNHLRHTILDPRWFALLGYVSQVNTEAKYGSR